MKNVGHIPSPYGVAVQLHRDPAAAPDSDQEFYFDIDGSMTLAGIHSPGDRERCKAAVKAACGKGGVPFQIFLDHGGRLVPRTQIPRPVAPVYPTLPRDEEQDIPIESWITLVMDHSRWDIRTAALLDIVGSNMEAARDWALPSGVLPLGLQRMMTAALEHLPDTEINCLEMAALYALTVHPEWSGPAIRWLEPVRTTWFADWVAVRPAYRNFAMALRSVNPALPFWIGGAE